MLCEAQNAVNPVGFTSILTKSQRKILVLKPDSSLNALAKKKEEVKDEVQPLSSPL